MDLFGLLAFGFLGYIFWPVFLLLLIFEIGYVGSALTEERAGESLWGGAWLLLSGALGLHLLGVVDVFATLRLHLGHLILYTALYAFLGVVYVVPKSYFEIKRAVRRAKVDIAERKEDELNNLKSDLAATGAEIDLAKFEQEFKQSEWVQNKLKPKKIEEFRGLVFTWWLLWLPDFAYMLLVRLWLDLFEVLFDKAKVFAQKIYNRMWSEVGEEL